MKQMRFFLDSPRYFCNFIAGVFSTQNIPVITALFLGFFMVELRRDEMTDRQTDVWLRNAAS